MNNAPPAARDLPGVHVYSLRAPGTGTDRYIGVTSCLRTRWHMHLSNARSKAKRGRPLIPVEAWNLELAAEGKRPVMRVLATFARREPAEHEEARLIREGFEAGLPLLNERATGKPGTKHQPHRCSVCGATGHSAADRRHAA